MPPAPRPDPERLAAFRSLLTTQTVLRDRLERELMEAHRISMASYEVLLLIYNHPERRMRIQDLARRSLLSKSGLSQLVSRLEALGLVAREGCDSDRRGVWASLTPKGRRLYLRASATHLRGIQEHFGQYLTCEEARELSRLLSRLAPGLC
jgi:DNA-binding MarR family transcriptional regulator